MRTKYTSKNFDLFKHLEDKQTALNHLNANASCISNILYCLNSICVAQGGFGKLSKSTGFGKESLYKSLCPDRNPRFDTIINIIRELGFDIRFIIKENSIAERHIRESSMAHLYANLSICWHPVKNKQLSPNDIMPGSRKKIWWQCMKNKDHEWQRSCNSIVSNYENNCPMCI